MVQNVQLLIGVKRLNVKKLGIFTPYSKTLNDEIVDFFRNEKFDVVSPFGGDPFVGHLSTPIIMKVRTSGEHNGTSM